MAMALAADLRAPEHEPLPPLILKGTRCLPIVQGGMGIGVSAHRLAGHVARLGAVGTIASVDLRRHHDDLMAATGLSLDKEAINIANRTALDREIRAAKAIAAGAGLVCVNVMRAVTDYAGYVRQSCESGADGVVVGAGLPLDLPDLTREHPSVALIPILSDARGAALVIKKWMRKNRLPDAIVIEHPRYAGGHLGASRLEDLADTRYDFANVLAGMATVHRELGLERTPIPVIVAGGIHTHEQVRSLIGQGASAVQLGTPFAVTEEGDAHPNFKRVLAEAKPEDIVTFVSVAGLPARAVRTPWLASYLKREARMQAEAHKKPRCVMAFDCLISCGLRDGLAKVGQFCIDHHLAAALKGDLARGLFFRGSERLPFGAAIRPVAELLRYLLTGEMSAAAAV